MNEVVVIGIVFLVVVLYLFWSRQHDRDRWQQKDDHEELGRAIQRELQNHEDAVLARCSQLDRKLTQHDRALRYIAKRLS